MLAGEGTAATVVTAGKTKTKRARPALNKKLPIKASRSGVRKRPPKVKKTSKEENGPTRARSDDRCDRDDEHERSDEEWDVDADRAFGEDEGSGGAEGQCEESVDNLALLALQELDNPTVAAAGVEGGEGASQSVRVCNCAPASDSASGSGSASASALSSTSSSRYALPAAPPPGAAPHRSSGPQPLLSQHAQASIEEEYSNDERLLNDFVRQHPMLSMEACTAKTVQLLATMTERAHVTIPELPEIPKSYDDTMLAPPDSAIGERPCVLGGRCLAVFLATLRYGSPNDRGFVCKEFLLPSQQADFLQGRGLPPQRQKCLLCQRYFMSYLYLMTRSDPSFCPCSSIALQTFCNAVAGSGDATGDASKQERELLEAAMRDGPMHCSRAACPDGYKRHAMLFVDEDFAASRAQRETGLGALQFRPFVRFCSTHYRYVPDGPGGRHRIVQVGIGVDDALDGLGFRAPSVEEGHSQTANH
jgi:hypothetical protein